MVVLEVERLLLWPVLSMSFLPNTLMLQLCIGIHLLFKVVTCNTFAYMVHRFIGTSVHSSDLHSVLTSVCEQIKSIYNKDELVVPNSLKDLVDTFQLLMLEESEARLAKPLYVILDSLDQFLGISH